MKSVCLFGDSVSKGVLWDAASKRYLLAKDSFANILGSTMGIDINNFSKLGCTVTKGEEIIEKHHDKIAAADITVLEFGGNDCDFDWQAISDAPEGLHIAKTPIEQFGSHYEKAVDMVRGMGGHPVILNLPPIHAQRYFDYVSDGRSAQNILMWLGGSAEYIYRWHEMYNMQVCRVANSLKVPMIDIRSGFLSKIDYGKLLCQDGIHPNPQGHLLISQAIQKYAAESQFA